MQATIVLSPTLILFPPLPMPCFGARKFCDMVDSVLPLESRQLTVLSSHLNYGFRERKFRFIY
jgi:hypothetical protein